MAKNLTKAIPVPSSTKPNVKEMRAKIVQIKKFLTAYAGIYDGIYISPMNMHKILNVWCLSKRRQGQDAKFQTTTLNSDSFAISGNLLQNYHPYVLTFMINISDR